ncbi:hypothetical protein [Gordonia insulae]|uniref:ESX-1 secretion-associated protein EspC n=1 Tax=Gordonia insulae TaxID=2420509 RepID=A0A3G8JJ47_9ACTN|nr:hypothetical protein [Gordonia insulae]AZG44958.1 hypothetical protein D7316_01550 [Gordonia insulae]
MGDAGMTVDTDEVARVVGFYHRAAEVVGAAADDIRRHDLGGWAVGEDYRELGDRYREMGRVIADRLTEQSRAAGRLSDTLGRGLSTLIAADHEAADDVGRAAGRRRAAGES